MQDLENETTIREVLTVRDVADHFDVAVQTIWRWVEAGDFPVPYRVGRRLRYWDAEQIDRWIEAGCPQRSSDA